MTEIKLINEVTKPVITPKFEYEVAKQIADNLVETFKPFCEKLNIAGSVRRQKPLVKDIEIVCLPKKVFFQNELFGNGTDLIIPGFEKAVYEVAEKKVRGSIHGRYAQFRLKYGIALDLFLPQPHDYYRQYTIRTGSGDYSRFVIATAWRKNGWCGTNFGLRRTRECYQEGSTWICYKSNPELPPIWKSEEEFFDWLGLKWIEPSERNA